MFSFLKFGKKNSPLLLERFYQHAGLTGADWVSIAINKNTIAGSLLTKELEILAAADTFSLKIAETPTGQLFQLWQNQRSQTKIQVDPQSPLLGQFNLLIDQLIEGQLFIFQTALNKSLSSKDFSAIEISQDEKALEWMRVSFKVLEKAIIESLTNPEFLFQALFFFGKNPKSQDLEIRLILFNLDIKFVFLKNGLVRIKIYNDKEQSFGSSQKAALEGDFNFRKREMLDELTKLISVISPGIKIS